MKAHASKDTDGDNLDRFLNEAAVSSSSELRDLSKNGAFNYNKEEKAGFTSMVSHSDR